MRKIYCQALVVLSDIEGYKRLFYGQGFGGDVGVESLAPARTEPDIISLYLFTEFVGYRSGKEIHSDFPEPAQVLYLPLELEVFGYWLVASSIERFPDRSSLFRVGNHFRLEKDIQVFGGPGGWKVWY